jgi:hypothetical protein
MWMFTPRSNGRAHVTVGYAERFIILFQLRPLVCSNRIGVLSAMSSSNQNNGRKDGIWQPALRHLGD